MAIVADPAVGWPAFERGLVGVVGDPDLRRIARQNLSMRRLVRLDPGRVAALAARLSG